MSSMLRSFASRKEGLTRFVKPISPSYEDSELDETVLFPFTYSNGVLDISYSGNNFEADMVDITGNAPEHESYTAVQILGTPYLVSSLGDNFKAYIRAWKDGIIDAGSPIEIYIAPQVVRVQEADSNNVRAISSSYRQTINPPSSDNYVAGSPANKYGVKCIFKTPLTFTIVESGVTQYITFQTAFDQEG